MEFIDTLLSILSNDRLNHLDKAMEICRQLQGHYIPSHRFLLRQHKYKQILDLYSAGQPVREIARKVGFKKSTVYNVIRNQNRSHAGSVKR